MHRLKVSCVVRPIYGSLGVKRLTKGWRDLHKDELDKSCFSTHQWVEKLQENEMGEHRRRILQKNETGVKKGVEAT